ncbi:dipeptide ABC transporter ATP-binding protein [Mannheimia haemolytica]|uniref:dipeptide ABC transporter ATP-binding protein n=1 Tax=Mannheimia haemolytica TaxID=75985 RepID=UPI00201BEAAB|nr:dipeptide ABC transporter ATP-binding protein [Mannheimia haemolytica]UQX69984.1 dipeptide ABC transporter ATP-binding protein [Mannheimia haemolytica]
MKENNSLPPFLKAVDLKKYYPVKKGMFAKPKTVKALDGVSFTLERGKTLAIVGESGCGKSTLGRMLTMIESPTEGELFYNGQNFLVNDKETAQLRRKKIQIVFQNPYSSLNPRKKVGSILEEPLLINTNLSAKERKEKVLEMMAKVGLKPEFYDRYPHMFSGGQRQRIAIARGLMLQPDIVVADEVMVMYLGRCVEQGDTKTIFSNPRHPYTQALLSATPRLNPEQRRERIKLTGELPSPLNPPKGCAFNARCRFATDRCYVERPELKTYQDGTRIACFVVEENN